MLRAYIDTGWLESDVDATSAVVALSSRMGVWVYVEGIVRASLHAGLTPYASILIKIHNAIFSVVERTGGTDGDAGGIGAVIAPHDREQSSCIWKTAFLHLLYPGAINAYGHLMFRLAGRRAGVTAYALPIVNDESVLHYQLTSEGHDPTMGRSELFISSKSPMTFVRLL